MSDPKAEGPQGGGGGGGREKQAEFKSGFTLKEAAPLQDNVPNGKETKEAEAARQAKRDADRKAAEAQPVVPADQPKTVNVRLLQHGKVE